MGVNKLPIIKAVLALTAVGVIVLAPFGASFAQEVPPSRGQALEISPTLATLDVDPGETTTLQVQLRNVSDEDLVVRGEINDFVASEEGGAPRILTDEENAEEIENNPYSFRGWAELPPELLLEPGDIETLETTINVPEDASPGGHYGIIRFSGTPPELDETGVSLSTSVGTLVLATVSGDIREDIEITEFYIAKDGQRGSFFESTPLQLVEEIRNSGNVHVQPTGRIAITDMFGRAVASPNVNLGRRNILPDSTRSFEQDIDSSLIGDKRLFGRYDAELEITYGEDMVVTDTLSFWVIPYRLIAVIILVLIAIFLAIRYSLKRYKKRILKQARTRRNSGF